MGMCAPAGDKHGGEAEVQCTCIRVRVTCRAVHVHIRASDATWMRMLAHTTQHACYCTTHGAVRSGPTYILHTVPRVALYEAVQHTYYILYHAWRCTKRSNIHTTHYACYCTTRCAVRSGPSCRDAGRVQACDPTQLYQINVSRQPFPIHVHTVSTEHCMVFLHC